MAARNDQFNANEILQLRPKLRRDLEFYAREYGVEIGYVVEDRRYQTFHQIGKFEFEFVSLFDGKTSILNAMYRTAKRFGDEAFSESEAVALVKWLFDNQLVESEKSTQTDQLVLAHQQHTENSRPKEHNPLLFKVSLLDPSSWFERITPWMAWCFSPWTMVAALLSILFAGSFLIQNWRDWWACSDSLWLSENWFCLLVSWLLMKLIHEMAHGVTCHHFGGNVKNAGLMFILFAPIPFVDVTSSWRFESKRKRVLTAASGMLIEIWIAAIAVIFWVHATDPIFKYHAFNIALLGTISTIVFNANFLMRFDGYYIFCDLFDLPNLAQSGQQYLYYLWKKYFVGVEANSPRFYYGKSSVVKAYGGLAAIWKVFVISAILLAASKLLFGMGLMLSILGVALWVVVPLTRELKSAWWGDEHHRPNRAYFITMASVSAVTVWSAFALIPSPFQSKASVIVEYSNSVTVRNATDGFVEAVLIKRGQKVVQGEPLLTLSNPRLKIKLEEIKLAIEQSELESRRRCLENDIASHQVELSKQESLRDKKLTIENRLENLVVMAPITGTVQSDFIESFPGRYIAQGSEICQIVNEDEKQLTVLVHQDEADHFLENRPVSICLNSRIPEQKNLGSYEPVAIEENIFPSLTTSGGGAITLAKSWGTDGQEKWKMLSPHFKNTIFLDETGSLQVRAGQTGTVYSSQGGQSLGEFIVDRIGCYFGDSSTHWK
ncbi:MAG: efflux RND transporter periplasmic adaptor subunit [Planctomycetota bacterium]